MGRESVLETLRLAEYAAEQQYDVALVRTPCFYRPQMRRAEVLTYYRMIADRSPLPVLLYSIPVYTAYDLPVDYIAELAQHPNIIGIKDSSGNVPRITELVAATRSVPLRKVSVTSTFKPFTGRMLETEMESDALAGSSLINIAQLGGAEFTPPLVHSLPRVKTRIREVGFQVLAGSAQSVLASLHAGASGAILGMAAFAPQSCAEVYMAWKDRDAVLETEKQARLVDAANRVVGQMGIPGIKFACDRNGYYGGVPRVPLLPLTVDEQREAASLLADLQS